MADHAQSPRSSIPAPQPANTQLAALSGGARSRNLQDDLTKTAGTFNLDTGAYILMGSAADRSSYESDRFHHGLLTYALLRGMKGDAILDDTRLAAVHWFKTAADAVEHKYAPMIGKEQKPELSVGCAQGGVPVGFLPPQIRDRIQLKDPASLRPGAVRPVKRSVDVRSSDSFRTPRPVGRRTSRL